MSERVEDVLSMGDTVEVRVTEIDPQGKVRLVRNDLPEIPTAGPEAAAGDREKAVPAVAAEDVVAKAVR